MSVYTVHKPPLRATDALADTDRFVFVRDGFYWWAFLLTPLWMLRHRLWLILVLYLVLTAAVDLALRSVGASAGLLVLVGVLISLLAGFEASTLRRFTLARRGWRNVGVVSGDDLEDAERRFFDAWVRQTPARIVQVAPPPGPPAPQAAVPRTSAASGVIGLFPEPGAQR
jgi:hypothetical protein